MFGVPFKITTDHKALLWYLLEEKNTKTTQTELARRVDQSLPLDYELEPIQGRLCGSLITCLGIRSVQLQNYHY